MPLLCIHVKAPQVQMATGPDGHGRFAACPVTLPGIRRDRSLHGRLKDHSRSGEEKGAAPAATDEVAMDAAAQAAARRCRGR